ncbi:MAG TPA: FHA domain-containing protein [Thermoanaerobaculia bacterium]|nr:FHA domain-containing protein [Thermoanaerobaculia bacterium]
MTRVLFEQFCFDPERMLLERGGEPVHLTPRAFRLLEFLIRQRPKAVSKRDILDYVWSGGIVEEANLKTLVNEIRTAVEERGGRAAVIRTVFGFGYAFAGIVEEAPKERDEAAPVLVVRWEGTSVSLPVGEHLIGRRPDCAVMIDSPSVSRVHAKLHVAPGSLRLEDLDSKNGTFVEGTRIHGTVPLLPRCAIRAGDVELRLARLDAGDASTETA